MCAIVVLGVDPDLLADQLTRPRERLPRRGHERGRRRVRLVQRPGGDDLHGSAVRLEVRDPADVERGERHVARQHRGGDERRIGEGLQLGVDSLGGEVPARLRVRRLHGGLDEEVADRHGCLVAAPGGRPRRGGTRRDERREEDEDGPEAFGVDSGHGRASFTWMIWWMWLRMERKSSELRVAVCARGRGSGTSIAATT